MQSQPSKKRQTITKRRKGTKRQKDNHVFPFVFRQWQDFERSYYGKLSPPCLLQDLLSHTQISSVLICILQHCVPGKQCNSWPCSRNTKSLMSYGTLLPLDYFISFILNLLSTCTVAKHCTPWLQLFVVKTLVSSLSRSSGSQHSFSKGQSGVSNWPSPEIHNIYLGFVLPKIALPNLEKKYWLFFFSITATSRQEGWGGCAVHRSRPICSSLACL